MDLFPQEQYIFKRTEKKVEEEKPGMVVQPFVDKILGLLG